jgi:hypothetical protein
MITKEQWIEVSSALAHAHGSAKLRIDGYEVTLSCVRVGAMKYRILVYVDGWSKGEWIVKDCEERRRFLCPRQKNLWSAKSKANLTKGLSKAAIKMHLPDLDKKHTSYYPYWPSFAPLKRHLVKHNQSIELANDQGDL